MHGKQNTAFFYASFISLGFVFRDAHSDERACKAADNSARTRARKSCHDRAGGDERTEAWNRQRSDADKPAQSPANHRSGSCSGGGPFGGLGGLFVSKILGSLILGKQNRDIGAAEPVGAQDINCRLCACAIRINSKNSRIFACHRKLSLVVF